jgi:hypothetical protein
MATKQDLVDWLYHALVALGGRGRIPELCKYVWENHESDLRASGDLFYTWQYDIRWAAYQLRQRKKMKSDEASLKGMWELIGHGS